MILVQSTDDKSHIWPAWYYHFTKWMGRYAGHVLFASETLSCREIVEPITGSWNDRIECFSTGTGHWSDRMQRIMRSRQCSNEVWYMHEDFFLTGCIDIGIMQRLEQAMSDHGLYLIKACGPNAGGLGTVNFQPSPIAGLVRYANSNDYLISHQASLWQREFLCSTCDYGRPSPWDHETKGTIALRKLNPTLNAWLGPMPLPYLEAFRGPRFRPGGEKMFQEVSDAYGIPMPAN